MQDINLRKQSSQDSFEFLQSLKDEYIEIDDDEEDKIQQNDKLQNNQNEKDKTNYNSMQINKEEQINQEILQDNDDFEQYYSKSTELPILNKEIRQEYLSEKLKNNLTNLQYNLNKYLDYTTKLIKQGDTATLLGKQVDEKQLRAEIKNIIWISYRKNIKFQSKTDLQSDTGWGCMIRVGQMILAQALKAHLLYKNKAKNIQKNNNYTNELMINIIKSFVDQDNDINNQEEINYSIHKVLEIAEQEFRSQPGDWYSPNRICYILQILHEQNPMKETEDLQIMTVVNDRAFVLEDIIQKMCKNQDKSSQKLCKNIDHQKKIIQQGEPPLICPKCHKSDQQLLLFLVCRIGFNQVSDENIKMINTFLDSKWSIGMIGGRPQRALYFIGRINDDYLYLDPHYVQESIQKEEIQIQNNIETYFCQDILRIKANKIDCSIGLGFYFQNLNEIEEFHQFLYHMKKNNEDFFIYLQREKDYLFNSEISDQGQQFFEISNYNFIDTQPPQFEQELLQQPEEEYKQQKDQQCEKFDLCNYNIQEYQSQLHVEESQKQIFLKEQPEQNEKCFKSFDINLDNSIKIKKEQKLDDQNQQGQQQDRDIVLTMDFTSSQ